MGCVCLTVGAGGGDTGGDGIGRGGMFATGRGGGLATSCVSYCSYAVTPYKCLGKISDILHLNNENNQLERRAWPLKDVPLDAQSWT